VFLRYLSTTNTNVEPSIGMISSLFLSQFPPACISFNYSTTYLHLGYLPGKALFLHSILFPDAVRLQLASYFYDICILVFQYLNGFSRCPLQNFAANDSFVFVPKRQWLKHGGCSGSPPPGRPSPNAAPRGVASSGKVCLGLLIAAGEVTPCDNLSGGYNSLKQGQAMPLKPECYYWQSKPPLLYHTRALAPARTQLPAPYKLRKVEGGPA
jgi:hypothetical protein